MTSNFQINRVLFSFFSIVLSMNIVFADPTDGCTDLEINQIFLTTEGSVLFNSDTDIAGFQFNVGGATLLGASGGAAADAGFTVSTGATGVVLGFSFSG